MKKAIVNWSGGKDCALAFYNLLNAGRYSPVKLVTTVGKSTKRVSMHGIREQLIRQQAASMEIPVDIISLPDTPSNEVYQNVMQGIWNRYFDEGICTSVFGDIFLEDIREYRDSIAKSSGISNVYPLWKKDTLTLVNEFIGLGFKAIVVAADMKFFDKPVLGKVINSEFVRMLPEGVDPCGENGEFHTFVFDGPVFKYPVRFQTGETVMKRYGEKGEGYFYIDLLPRS
jgi:uncharacterized protein (TIGR00290 family)